MSADDTLSIFGITHDDLELSLALGGKPLNVAVERVQGREALSELFVYEVTVVSTEGEAGLSRALAEDATITVKRNDAVVRTVHGILAEVHPDGSTLPDSRRRRAKLVVLPKLAELQRIKSSRTWKRSDDVSRGLTVTEIVESLLAEWEIKPIWSVDRELERYVLRTQFEETDFDFMCRLLAFEGIHFYFLHEPSKTTVVFSNAPGSLKIDQDDKVRPGLPFRDTGTGVTGDHVRRLRCARKVRTDAVVLTDFNYERPSLDMVAWEPDPAPGRRLVYEHPGGYSRPAKEGEGRARRRLEELNDSEQRYFGEANCPRLSAGFRFDVRDHQDRDYNGKFVATHVIFSAAARGVSNAASDLPLVVEFRSVRAETPLRPATRPSPRPPIQTAKVVGPRPNEPHLHAPGMVKVRFYWDLAKSRSEQDMSEEVFNEARCAWARVTTDMAGPGYGAVSWPRVGMEVVVDFLNGRIDEPVVIRTLYNGQNTPPYDIPGEGTRTGFKSSTVGGDGHNEWFFEDRAGKELVYLHAQRDRKTNINKNDSESVGGSQTVSVGGAQTESVGGPQTISVGGARTETVGANENVTVAGSRTHTVEGHSSLTAKSRTVDIAESHGTTIGGNHGVIVRGEDLLAVSHGRHHHINSVDELTVFGGNRVVTVHGNEYVNVDSLLRIVAPNVQLDASTEVSILCGGTKVLLKKDGTVNISGSKEIKIEGGGSSVVVDAAGVTVKGGAIKLNC